MNEKELEMANRLAKRIAEYEKKLEAWEKFDTNYAMARASDWMYTYVDIPTGGLTKDMLEELRARCIKRLEVDLFDAKCRFECL